MTATVPPSPGHREPQRPQSPRLDPEVLAFAHEVFELARSGRDRQLAELIDAGLSPNLTNDKGDCLLMLAAYHGHEQTVRALLTRGADHSRINDRGQTALGAAVFRRTGAVTSALLEAGADPELGGPSAVELARFFDLPEMLALLRRA